MKKFLLLLLIALLLISALPLTLWWMTLQSKATVAFQENPNQAQDLGRIHQFIKQNTDTPTHKRVEFSEQDLNQLFRHSSQQFKRQIDFSGHANLHPERSRLLISINTHLPLRPYLNLGIDFSAQGKQLILLGGHIGSLTLPQASVELLVNMSMPYLQQHPQYHTGSQLWQSIEAISIKEKTLIIDFIINQQMQAELQQQQLEILIGKSALERLGFYQQAIEHSFANRLGQRIKLHEVMQTLFALAVKQQQLGADAIADNKAILLALFLHMANHQDFALLNINQHIRLPENPIELTIERRKDLATHFLSTATITLFANSSIADAIGLYKELQDQKGISGFSASDLIADRAGSLFASQLIDPASATQLQQSIALSQQEQDFFPATKALAAQLEKQLQQDSSNQQELLVTIEQQINQHARSANIYQSLEHTY